MKREQQFSGTIPIFIVEKNTSKIRNNLTRTDSKETNPIRYGTITGLVLGKVDFRLVPQKLEEKVLDKNDY